MQRRIFLQIDRQIPLTECRLIGIINIAVKKKTLHKASFGPRAAQEGVYIAGRGGGDLAKDLGITILLDFYGDMLTEKQRDFLGYYYNDDLSLSEIAENEGITRQGVRDSIKRAEAQLFDMEERLGLARRFHEMRRGLDDIVACANAISEYNMRYGLSREINDTTVKIKAIAQTLCEV